MLRKHQLKLEATNSSSSLEDTLTTAFTMHNKAVLEMVNGIFKHAIYYFKEAADIKEAFLGPKHKSVLETLEQLAVAMYGAELYNQSLATFRYIHARSTSHALATRIWNGIACIHFRRGKHDFAFQCAIRASARQGEDEVAPRIALANHGYMQLSRGKREGRATLKAADTVSTSFAPAIPLTQKLLTFLHTKQLSEWLGPGNEIVQSIRYNMNR